MNADLKRLLDNRLADSTNKGYASALREWFVFAEQEKIPSLPAAPLHVANFLATMANKSESVSKVNTTAAAIAEYHKKNFVPSPTAHETVKMLLDAVKRRYGKAAVRRTPITPEILEALASDLRSGSAPLQQWRTVWRVTIAFHALLRWDEVSKLKRSDLSMDNNNNKLTIRIKRSKTDQMAEGASVVIEGSKCESCPVRLTKEYYKRLGYSSLTEKNAEDHMQPRIRHGKRGDIAIPGTTVSYTTAMEDLKKYIKKAGFDATGFGEHSARRGGATTAAAGGLSWLDLKRHGRWKSDQAAQLYVDSARGQGRAASVLAKAVSDASQGSSLQSTSSGNMYEAKKRSHRRPVKRKPEKRQEFKDELHYAVTLQRRSNRQ